MISHPASQEEAKRHFSKYKDWLASLGSSVVSPANPLKNTSTVNSDGTVSNGGTTTMSGYTIIEADSMEEALSNAKTCPFLDIGGSLEVSEIVDMPAQKYKVTRIHRDSRNRCSCLALPRVFGDAKCYAKSSSLNI